MKSFNSKYKNVFYEGKEWRIYDERTTNSFDALFSETQIKLIEFVEKYNFKIFYFKCSPATKHKMFVANEKIDLKTKDIIKIKNDQESDLFYLYKNQICEVFYSFLKLDFENNYYFDFMLVVKQDFDLNRLYNYNFKTVKINSVVEIFKNDISFEFVEKIFSDRVITLNNAGPADDEDHYKIHELAYGIENYRINIKNGSDDFDYAEYFNFNSFYFYKRFNQDRYAKGCFRLLCSHIWTSDRLIYKEKNKHGIRIAYREKYNMMSPFLTNFADLMNCVSATFDENGKAILKQENYTHCTLCDNLKNQGICLSEFIIEWVVDKKTDFDKLEIIDENGIFE